MKFKYKVEIVIDEEKVINDDIYDPKKCMNSSEYV